MIDETLTQPEDELAQPVEDENPSDAAHPEAVDTGARLIVKRNGTETEETFPLHGNSVVGRFDPAVGPIDVDLAGIPEGTYVSRKHAKIVQEDGVWKVRDLGSSNGTFLLRGDDFERVEEGELADGDEIALGNARFVFRTS